MRPNHFFVVPFAPTGERVGIGGIEIANLSGRWIEFCSAMLLSNPPWFEKALGGPLDHIHVTFRASIGSARLTFTVHDVLCVSSALLSGQASGAETVFIHQFRTDMAKIAAPLLESEQYVPFCDLETVSERPAAMLVVWPPTGVSEEDCELVRELHTHLAASFFLREAEGR